MVSEALQARGPWVVPLTTEDILLYAPINQFVAYLHHKIGIVMSKVGNKYCIHFL